MIRVIHHDRSPDCAHYSECLDECIREGRANFSCLFCRHYEKQKLSVREEAEEELRCAVLFLHIWPELMIVDPLGFEPLQTSLQMEYKND